MKFKNKITVKKNLTFKETNLLILDCKKSKKELGWNLKWNVNKSIEMTAKWYAEYITKPKNIKKLTLSQIEEFFK
jgi:dTDP-D-glucose 4,6-dehydratase